MDQPILRSSVTNPVFIYEGSNIAGKVKGAASCWKQTLCNGRQGFSSSAWIRNCHNILRCGTEAAAAGACVFIATVLLFQLGVNVIFGIFILGYCVCCHYWWALCDFVCFICGIMCMGFRKFSFQKCILHKCCTVLKQITSCEVP